MQATPHLESPTHKSACLLFKYKEAPAYSDDPSEADLAQRPGHRVALSHVPLGPDSSAREAPLWLPGVGSESWPRPRGERKCFHSSEREERSFHLPEIKLQPGGTSEQEQKRKLEKSSTTINSPNLQTFLGWFTLEKLCE